MPARYAAAWLLAWFILCPGRALAAAQCVAVTVEVDIPAGQAWAVLSDFSVPHNYVPGLTRTEVVSAQGQGVGAHRRVYDEDGDFLEETIIEWDQGRGFVISLHEGEQPMAPFERAEFSYGLEPVPGNLSLIELALTVEMPWGAVGAVLGRWIVAPLLRANLVQVAAGLKHYYETGRPATDADRERLAAKVRKLEQCHHGFS